MRRCHNDVIPTEVSPKFFTWTMRPLNNLSLWRGVPSANTRCSNYAKFELLEWKPFVGFSSDFIKLFVAIQKSWVATNKRIKRFVQRRLTVFLGFYFMVETREYWMVYRGPGFLAVAWFGSSPAPSPLFRQQVVSLSHSSCVSPVDITYGGDGVGEEPNHTIARKPGPL